jgi:hypothetical protein
VLLPPPEPTVFDQREKKAEPVITDAGYALAGKVNRRLVCTAGNANNSFPFPFPKLLFSFVPSPAGEGVRLWRTGEVGKVSACGGG